MIDNGKLTGVHETVYTWTDPHIWLPVWEITPRAEESPAYKMGLNVVAIILDELVSAGFLESRGAGYDRRWRRR